MACAVADDAVLTFFKMEDKKTISSASPSLIQRNTPVRRLGLSRKRKSSCLEINPNKLQANSSYKSPLNSSVSVEHVESEDKEKKKAAEIKECEHINNKRSKHVVKVIENRLTEAEGKPNVLKETVNSENVDSEIKELKSLYEVWKNGCKEAMLHLLELLKEKQPEFNSVEKVAVKLGIWDAIQSTFEKDSDFLSYEN